MLRNSVVLPKLQTGVILLITLILLSVMIIGGAALSRSVDTTTLIVGNLAFRHSARQAADIGIETAIDWIEANSTGTALQSDQIGSGYLSRRQDPAAGQSWDDFWNSTLRATGAILKLPLDKQGNTIPFGLADGVFRPNVSYVIQRICAATGAPEAADCPSSPFNLPTGNSKGGSKEFQAIQKIYYRITCRVAGPGNIVSYVQAFVLI